MSKQDRQGVRTASDLESKYKFGKTFAEVFGLAEEAQKTANDVRLSVDKLDNDLDQTEIFNRLTDNGRIQGVYMEDGEIYINAEYIQSLEKLFAKDIEMTGKFESKTMAFIEPGLPELEQVNRWVLQLETPTSKDIALYDFNNNGEIDIGDLVLVNQAYLGLKSLSSWSGAVQSEVSCEIDMSNPSKAVKLFGTNMWGRYVENYLGIQNTNLPLTGGIMGGIINMNGYGITGLSTTPTQDTDAIPLGFANANYAPNGFGLGKKSTWLSDDIDVDTITSPGWYSYGQNNISANKPFAIGEIFILSKGIDTACYQVGTTRSPNGSAQLNVRRMLAGTWNEWEWVNPPMEANVEYRTIERWNGLPVYVKRVNFGALPSNSTKYVQPGIDFSKAFSFSGVVYNDSGAACPLPYVNSSGAAIAWWRTDTSGKLLIQTTSSVSNWTAEFIIKYTK
jgi:hypothetical protein